MVVKGVRLDSVRRRLGFVCEGSSGSRLVFFFRETNFVRAVDGGEDSAMTETIKPKVGARRKCE